MTVGEILRQARVGSGLDLDTLARETRISRRYLEAIEADDTSGVPGQFFYRSFVRQYAEALGLDPADVAQELPAPAQPPIIRHAPVREPEPIVASAPIVNFGGRATTWVSVLAFIAVVAGCSALYAWYRSRQVAPPVTAQTTESAPAPAPRNTPVAAPDREQPAPTPTTGDTARESPTTSAPAPAPNPQPAPPATAAAVPQPSPEDKVQVAVSSTEAAWISLMSDGKQVFAGTLQPGQVKTVAGKEQARLRVGNAGGIDVTYNGKLIGSIGPKGQVRTVVFTPQGFEIVKPVVKFEEDYEKPGT